MGVAGIKWGPYLSTIHSFSISLNEEALLKVESFIQKYWLVLNLPIFQIYWFFKKGPKNQQILENSNFFCISGGNFIGLFNGMLFVFILCGHWYTEGNCRKISIGRHCIRVVICIRTVPYWLHKATQMIDFLCKCK